MKNKILLGVAFLFFSVSAYSSNAWYWGKLKSIETLGSDGSFLVYTDHPTLNQTCLHDQIQFRVSDMGAERTKIALSMALAALASGKEWGVVVNLPDVDSVCYASSTTSTGAAIR